MVSVFGYGGLSAPYYYIDMELCEFTLTDYLYKERVAAGQDCFNRLQPPLKIKMIWHIMTQIADGVVFIHKEGYVHRDLKPNNSDIPTHKLCLSAVLYKNSDWKIADFGLSLPARTGETIQTLERRGCEGYRSPEVLEGKYGREVDIWSLGCILYELASGKQAFPTDPAIWRYILQNEPIDMSLKNTAGNDVAKNCISKFVSEMLGIKPSERPSATKVFNQSHQHWHPDETHVCSPYDCAISRNVPSQHVSKHSSY